MFGALDLLLVSPLARPALLDMYDLGTSDCFLLLNALVKAWLHAPIVFGEVSDSCPLIRGIARDPCPRFSLDMLVIFLTPERSDS